MFRPTYRGEFVGGAPASGLELPSRVAPVSLHVSVEGLGHRPAGPPLYRVGLLAELLDRAVVHPLGALPVPFAVGDGGELVGVGRDVGELLLGGVLVVDARAVDTGRRAAAANPEAVNWP